MINKPDEISATVWTTRTEIVEKSRPTIKGLSCTNRLKFIKKKKENKSHKSREKLLIKLIQDYILELSSNHNSSSQRFFTLFPLPISISQCFFFSVAVKSSRRNDNHRRNNPNYFTRKYTYVIRARKRKRAEKRVNSTVSRYPRAPLSAPSCFLFVSSSGVG